MTDPYSRHPALITMAVATLDETSGGRAVLGIGAGVSGFQELGVRRKRPAIAIQLKATGRVADGAIMQGCVADEALTYFRNNVERGP